MHPAFGNTMVMKPIFASTSRSTATEKHSKLLLIEDNPGDARLVEILLEESDFKNYSIVNHITLSEGMAAIEKEDFDVVMLDLSLPDSRGFETLQQLITRFPDVNVIVMTGFSDKTLGLDAVKAGAQDFLMKGGFDADMLSKTLRYSIERKNVLRKLAESQRARELAEESAKLKEEFIAGISHEMRTPMNAIYGMSNLLINTNLNEDQQGYIQSILQSSEVLLGVINDILEISTLQNGKMDFEEKDFDLDELLTNLVNVMQYKKNEKVLDFILDVDKDLPRKVKGDKLRLNQILFNIVGNAVKFTDAGFVRIKVGYDKKSSPSVGEKMVFKFAIQDSGIGIPGDKLDHIFDAFTRVRTKERLFEGTGLGLAIVKNLITQQGGRIWAESTLGKGTTIFFELPLTPRDAKDNQITETQKATISYKKCDAKRSFDLLLVEDHKINQIVARKTLEKEFPNIRLVIANHGKEAIEILEKRKFNLILMDIQMPVMDGNETTQYIRKNMPEVLSPILAMTAHAYISKDNIFKSYGFDDFVLKPFEPEQLFSKIHEYLDKSLVLGKL